ncbi:tRNase Z endonuclease [Rhizoctonia solani]|uniref:ribonuclease Z n=1 Tax=Rhizoctonia solani TaxID=456999 RepID=A0A8H7IH56_9AGAM|nr:tRNase Z endonuclease [Rhizoctonia solani]
MKVSRLGGLTGMLMSLADAGVTGIDVLGPPGLNHFLPLLDLTDWMSANTTEITQAQGLEKIYEDTFIRVYAFSMSPQISEAISIPVKRKASGGSLRSSSPKRPVRDNSDGGSERSGAQHSRNTSTLKGVEADEWRATIIRDMFPGRSSQNQAPATVNKENSPPGISRAPRPRRSLNRLPVFEGSISTSVAYLILGPEIRGKFDPKAADALGVPKRERGKLTKGESVTVTVNGVQNIITPDMCMGESEAPTGFLIIDCPTKDYIPSLPDPQTFHPIRSETPFVLGSIYHRAGSGVLRDPRYRSWVATVAPPECNRTPLVVLSELDKDMFFAPRENDSKDEIAKLNNVFQNPYILCPGFVTEMTPPKPPVLKLFPGPTFNRRRKRLIQQARQQISDLLSSHTHDPAPGDDFRVTTLGTGSALPSKYRNVISTVIQMPNYGSIILDCGENTWGQMCRRFGVDETAPENAYSVLADVKCIFVSHIHGDHHMGLLRLLTTRRAVASELCVREYHDLEDIGLDVENGVRIVQIEKPRAGIPEKVIQEEITGLLGFDSIEAVPCVIEQTHALVLLRGTTTVGALHKLLGDTMPCDTLPRRAKTSHFSSTKRQWRMKNGRKLLKRAIVLLDKQWKWNERQILAFDPFLAEVPKIPIIKSGFTATALAFDYMTISTPHFWKVGSYMGALEKVFELN